MLAYAIPDHPWIDSADGAAVRIAMTVAAPGHSDGILAIVTSEQARDDGENEVVLVKSVGVLAPNLQIGADLTSSGPLQANSNLANHGVIRGGEGFLVKPDQLLPLGFGRQPGIEKHLRPILNGSDITSTSRANYVIDLYGLTEPEVRDQFPEIYQWVFTHVRPGRVNNKRTTRRDNWWLFNESVPKLRSMLVGLPRFISTSETAKHRVFVFVGESVLPEHKLVNIASDDAFVLGILSSSIHVTWSLASGSWLGVGNDSVYVKTRCFETFPFPALKEGYDKQRIRDLGERLDAHRKRQQEQHPGLTLTGMYNVLEILRSGDPLTPKDKLIHDQGLVSVLRQIHDELDAAVLEAYGWSDLKWGTGGPPVSSPTEHGQAARAPLEQAILTRLVALNHERAAEEKRGLIRWLRPEFQAPQSSDGHRPPLQGEIEGIDTSENSTSNIQDSTFPDWPAELPAQVIAIRKLLPTIGQSPDTSLPETSASSVEPLAERLAACFGRKSKKRLDQITAILDTLKALGLIA